ncbi:MAG: hypothetical protein RBU21_01050 [FCB group bacterium]|jgi:hypothetical protein|nr:hypothetical protein [FCB group bacterium]
MSAATRKGQTTDKPVSPELIAKAIAKAVWAGNFVNFKFLFLPFSPARADSSERFDAERYSYLLPDDRTVADPGYQQALSLVRREDVWRHVESELEANRPAQLPSDLLLLLADNAVRAGKYTSAALAYELLRVRSRMQEEFFAEADRALDRNDIAAGVHGYLIGTGLAYDYAAFPEPLPEVADFQVRALALHGDYPERPEDCIALQPREHSIRTALGYLLLSAEAEARLAARPMELREAFLEELVRRRDPQWDAFAARYREASSQAVQLGARLRADAEQSRNSREGLMGELAAEQLEEAQRIMVRLLGREVPQGEWWQYLKELAYEHPPAVLFVGRQLVGDTEVIIPLYRSDSPLPARLGLVPQP